MSKQHSKLDWLEAGRGLAAVAVMVSHVNDTRITPIDPDFLGFLGGSGVAFFFVLSGFIMAHVHVNDIGHPQAAAHFAWRRLGRIFPTYWVVFACGLAVNQLLERPAARVDPGADFLLHNIFLLPTNAWLVSQAWTLVCELFFYACFISLIVNRWVGRGVLCVWLCSILWRMLFIGPYASGIFTAPDIYMHQVNLYFFVGMAVQWAARHGRAGAFSAVCAAVGALLLCGPSMFPPAATGLSLQPVIGQLFAWGSVVAGCVALSQGRWRAPYVLQWLGAISYSLYLIHLLVFHVLRGVDKATGGVFDQVWPIRVVVQIACGLAVAALLHRYFEKPVLRWINTRHKVLWLSVERPPRRL